MVTAPICPCKHWKRSSREYHEGLPSNVYHCDCIFIRGVILVSCVGSHSEGMCHSIPLLHFIASCELFRICMYTKNNFRKGVSLFIIMLMSRYEYCSFSSSSLVWGYGVCEISIRLRNGSSETTL